ncbi:replicative DNA helicase [Polluticoccus soli]|uniref:replicative DNA helicase n=1 Tax=Polluticoccus soli TaxID=3034150 RepID=UPI0023E203EB|nr:replicative DNA helicase [Flavipsychrobacter sp. JY13-12]
MAVNIKKDFGNTRSRKPDITSLVYGKVPPQAPELEEAVLGAVMLEKDKLAEVLEIIQSEDCFYVDAHQKIYASIRRLFDKGMPVDLLTVTEELRRSSELEIVGGAYYLTRLTMSVVSSAHVEAHARIVMEKFIQRELIRISGSVISDAYEDSTDVFDLLDKAESNLYEITDKHLRKNFKSLKEVLVNTVQEIEEAKNKKESVTGVPTGYTHLDRVTSGWQKNALIIVAARPAVGKTAFCLNLAMNAAMNSDKPFPVAFFSLEMGAGELVKRMLACQTEIGMDAITKGRMQEHEFVQMTQRMNKLASAPIFLDDQAALNIFELRAKARRLKQKYDIKMIIIDYLQLMQASINGGGNREQEISKISRDLKSLAKELEIPIIALSQLNRSVESRKESKVPQLSDLRESGAIEQDADMVMFLYRPEYYGINNDEMGQPIEGETHVHIAKNRSGSTDTVKVRFIKEYQKFVDLPDDDFGSFGGGGGFGPFAGGGGGNSSFDRASGGGGGGFKPQNENPAAGIRGRQPDTSDFGGSKMFIPGGFQTMPSKANDYNFDDDDMPAPFKQKPNPGQMDEDAPF